MPEWLDFAAFTAKSASSTSLSDGGLRGVSLEWGKNFFLSWLTLKVSAEVNRIPHTASGTLPSHLAVCFIYFRMIKYLWLMEREEQCSWSDYMDSDLRVTWRTWHNFIFGFVPKSELILFVLTLKSKSCQEDILHSMYMQCVVTCGSLCALKKATKKKSQHALFPWAVVIGGGS